jgi:hypothetical protein
MTIRVSDKVKIQHPSPELESIVRSIVQIKEILENETLYDEVVRKVFAGSPGMQTLQTSSGSLPDGGTTGQVLAKQSNADGDADWEDIVFDGGGA